MLPNSIIEKVRPDIEVGIFGSEKLTMLNGLHPLYTGHKIPNATGYHFVLNNKEFIVLQHIGIGPYSCWYTNYKIAEGRQMYSRLQTEDVELHSLLNGSAIYNIGEAAACFKTEEGTNNVIVNHPEKSQTTFTSAAVETFDIHIKKFHFEQLTKQYNNFKRMKDSLKSGEFEVLYDIETQQNSRLTFQIKSFLYKLCKRQESEDGDGSTKLSDSRIRAHLDQIVETFATLDATRNKTPHFRSTVIDSVVELVGEIDAHYTEKLSFSKLSEDANQPRKTLNSAFKALLGETPKSYQIRKRIGMAKGFIESSPNMSVKEIGTNIGIPDTRHLNRFFIKYTGRSIDQYRAERGKGTFLRFANKTTSGSPLAKSESSKLFEDVL